MFNLVLLLSDKSLYFYNKKGDKLNQLEFEEGVISDYQIIKSATFSQKLADFVNQLTVKQQSVLILLSHELAIKKILPRAEDDKTDFDPNEILKDISIPKSKLIYKLLKTKDELHVFASHADLINTLSQAFTNLEWKVDAIIPFSIYSKTTKHEDHISDKTIDVILKDSELIEMGNMLDSSKVSTTSISTKNQKYYSPVLFIFIMVIIVGLILSYLYYTITFPSIRLDLSNQIASSNTPTPDQNSNISPTPTPVTIDKATLKVKVSNGSGVAGQAGEVRDQLKTLGFQNIETGNASDYNSAQTLIIFSSKVPDQVQTEVISKLKATFDKIDSKIDPTASFDIFITTGTD